VSRRAAFVVVAIEDVRMPLVPFVRSPVRIASGPAGVPAGGDGVRPDTTGHACPEPVRSWRPSWTPDTTARTSDGDQAGGRSGAAGVGRRRACALPSCPVMARMSRPHGWPWPAGQTHGRTLDAEGVRRLTAAVRTGSRPIGWAVTLNWGCPADRTVERSAMSLGRPATAGCPQEELIGRRRCPGGCRASAPWRKGRPAGQRACPACHGEVLEVPTGRSRVGCAGRPAAPARRPAFRHRSADGRGWAGGSAGIGERLLSVGAGGPGGGFCSTSVVSRRG
jgi:hypothetical protein